MTRVWRVVGELVAWVEFRIVDRIDIGGRWARQVGSDDD